MYPAPFLSIRALGNANPPVPDSAAAHLSLEVSARADEAMALARRSRKSKGLGVGWRGESVGGGGVRGDAVSGGMRLVKTRNWESGGSMVGGLQCVVWGDKDDVKCCWGL